jgi:hypothetical protein
MSLTRMQMLFIFFAEETAGRSRRSILIRLIRRFLLSAHLKVSISYLATITKFSREKYADKSYLRPQIAASSDSSSGHIGGSVLETITPHSVISFFYEREGNA